MQAHQLQMPEQDQPVSEEELIIPDPGVETLAGKRETIYFRLEGASRFSIR